MNRFISMLLILMSSGCATLLRTDIATDEAGYVVYAIGADEFSRASHYALQFRDAARRESMDRTFYPVGNPHVD